LETVQILQLLWLPLRTTKRDVIFKSEYEQD